MKKFTKKDLIKKLGMSEEKAKLQATISATPKHLT